STRPPPDRRSPPPYTTPSRPLALHIQQPLLQPGRRRHVVRPEHPRQLPFETGEVFLCGPQRLPPPAGSRRIAARSSQHADQALRAEEHTSEVQSRENLVCRLL